jgi:Holliday junction resolvase RusA-like endonuclease
MKERREAAFVIHGNPVPKGRPRCVRGRAAPLTPEKTRAYESHVAWSWATSSARAGWGKEPSDQPVALTAQFYLGTRRLADIDNLCKALLDGLNGGPYEDDRQVVGLTAYKFYSKENPRTVVAIVEVDADPKSE